MVTTNNTIRDLTPEELSAGKPYPKEGEMFSIGTLLGKIQNGKIIYIKPEEYAAQQGIRGPGAKPANSMANDWYGLGFQSPKALDEAIRAKANIKLYDPGVVTDVYGAGSTLSSGASGGATGGGAGSAGGDITGPASGAFKDSAAYKALSADEKAFVDIAFNTVQMGGEADARAFANAIAQASAIADPYFKAQFTLAKGEFESQIAYAQGDLERQSEIIARTRNELLADVKNYQKDLSLEQQAEIARQTKDYSSDLLNIADTAAERGLTFAGGARSRVMAEQQRGEQFQNVIQSGQRTYNIKQRELQYQAERGDVNAAKQLEALKAKSAYQLQGIGRSAEEALGSLNVPSGTGYAPVGGVMGSLEEKKRKSMLSDIYGFFQLQQGFNQ